MFLPFIPVSRSPRPLRTRSQTLVDEGKVINRNLDVTDEYVEGKVYHGKIFRVNGFSFGLWTFPANVSVFTTNQVLSVGSHSKVIKKRRRKKI